MSTLIEVLFRLINKNKEELLYNKIKTIKEKI